jgi:hypothetical protein
MVASNPVVDISVDPRDERRRRRRALLRIPVTSARVRSQPGDKHQDSREPLPRLRDLGPFSDKPSFPKSSSSRLHLH